MEKKEQCCPKFDPAPWEGKTHIWKNKLFIEDDIKQLFHMPINMGPVITRMWKKIEDAGAKPEDKDFLMLAYDPSPWKSEFYISVTRKVPEAKNVTLSGSFISKVFEGPYNAVPKWIKEMDEYLSSINKKAKRYLFYYTTCPKCAKIYGKNYVVVFAEIE